MELLTREKKLKELNLKLKELNLRLNNCINNDLYINIHIKGRFFESRHCIIPEVFKVTKECIYIEKGFFYFDYTDEIKEIEYIEEDESYHIKMATCYFILDFI